MAVSDNIVDVSSGDVSANEVVNVSGNDVSVGDVVTAPGVNTITEVQYMTGEYDADMLAELQQTNYLLTALLFFTVFTWISQKLHNSVKKVVSIDE